MMKEAGLYIHFPFCRSKCPYCGFVSFPCQSTSPPSVYLEILQKQIREMSNHPWCREQRFTSIFLGGGTPTIYKGEELGQLVLQALEEFPFSDDREISCETNPNTVDIYELSQLRESGVNRLSIGVQSLSSQFLEVLGRSHSCEEAIQAFHMARQAGFDNINLDFIYGLPGQTVNDLCQTLQKAFELHPEHLALYEMTLEPGTPFGKQFEKKELLLPTDDVVAEMEEQARILLGQAGYRRYEISNYALSGFECRHNINYWKNGSYLGLGVSAVSCFNGLRLKNCDSLEQYIDNVEQGVYPLGEGEGLSIEAAFRESVITGLRMIEGVSLAHLRKRFGLDPREYYGKKLAGFEQQDMVVIAEGRMRLTAKSLPVANQILAELV